MMREGHKLNGGWPEVLTKGGHEIATGGQSPKGGELPGGLSEGCGSRRVQHLKGGHVFDAHAAQLQHERCQAATREEGGAKREIEAEDEMHGLTDGWRTADKSCENQSMCCTMISGCPAPVRLGSALRWVRSRRRKGGKG